MPTVLAAAEIAPPKECGGQSLLPMEGVSLLPTFTGGHLPERILGFEHQQARGLRKGDWKLAWGKRMTTEPTWELYNLKTDRAETNNLAADKPELVKELSEEWTKWAKRVGVDLRD